MFLNHSVIGRLREGMTPEQAGGYRGARARIRENYPAVIRNSPCLC